ncbi:uncharacterized protein LOC131157190 [Malania oleifera]|uniref:uncharacterized protein LOC131157190 n=1 Tax=Malania oleifera TaxID=397392 RepID=UPI0025AE942F|nr:uncharacterized protein LOC131157190 [Malania oleifera]
MDSWLEIHLKKMEDGSNKQLNVFYKGSSDHFVDGLMNFLSDIGDDDNDDDKTKASLPSSISILTKMDLDDCNCSFPEVAKEELEWLSKKDAFSKQRSWVSILETSNSNSTGRMHSNSHRKVIEMRKLRQSEVVVAKSLDMSPQDKAVINANDVAIKNYERELFIDGKMLR